MMEVISSRRYEARPPVAAHSAGPLVEPENTVASVKEEEWETRKKKEITTTRQIETRVKRQVVLEDGEVVVDSGPLVTTNTTEDVEQQEHTTQERRTVGDEPKEVQWPIAGDSSPGVVKKELNETVVRSREEVQERLETEDRQQLGDISDEVYLKAIKNNRGDIRVALAESSTQVVPHSGPRVLQHTTKTNKVVDTENTLEKSSLQPDGRIITETKRTVEHEEVNDDEVPDDRADSDDGSEKEVKKESSQRFAKRKDEELVDYVSGGERVAREMRYISETTEGERTGDWPPPPTTMRTTRLAKHTGFPAEAVPAARKDALTKKPLDLEEEDEARKVETSKWLESHFGSESRSSHGSLDPEEPAVQSGTNTSFINVTMKSLPMNSSKERDSGWDRDHQTTYSSHHQLSKRSDRRDSNSSAGFYHGISEWSERYQNQTAMEKQSSSSPYTETVRSNGHYESGRNQPDSTYSHKYEKSRQQVRDRHEVQDPVDAPSPPLRRRAREQLLARTEGKSYSPVVGRTASPVYVVQRTWENRSRAVQQSSDVENRRSSIRTPPRSRSTSPTPAAPSPAEPKKNSSRTVTPRTAKASGQSKYKIGESFRKLVGKLRSASSERKNKRSSSSTSQLTQTDDSSTYLQYNVIDKNIPLVTDFDSENKPPERPPRSPKAVAAHWQRTADQTAPPVQRYYLGEDPFGGSIYGREKGYRGAKPPSRQHQSSRIEPEHRAESNSLGRFSKSTSRLTNEHERNEQFRSAQTLPRKLQTQLRQPHGSSASPSRHRPSQGPLTSLSAQSTAPSSNSRQYGSMINISIKNTVKSPKLPSNSQGPAKPERTYKSSLLRSKSFNIEANRNGNDPSVPYKSNLQLNRLDETPPLKSPGILASISRSNRDLFKSTKYEY